MPGHAGFDPGSVPVALQQMVHPFQIEQDAPASDRLAFGGEATASAGDRRAFALSQLEHTGDILRRPSVHHGVWKTVDHLTAIGLVASPRGSVGAENHATIVGHENTKPAGSTDHKERNRLMRSGLDAAALPSQRTEDLSEVIPDEWKVVEKLVDLRDISIRGPAEK